MIYMPYRIVKTLNWILVVIFVIETLLFCVFSIEPIPLIRKREFPFFLKYEVNGETYSVFDVLVCEFGGYTMTTADMQFSRQWKAYLKSGKERITLLETAETEIFYSHLSRKAYGAVYMGDTEVYSKVRDVFPNAWYSSSEDNEKAYIISAKDMSEKYNIKLLDYEIAPPVKNVFLDIRIQLAGLLLFIIALWWITHKSGSR